MPKEAPAAVSVSVDPLTGVSGLSLFPRTIRASADAPVPDAPKDLDSIHNIMKSTELRSPEKLMSESKKIVDGGTDILSNFYSYAESVSITNEFAAKVKDRPQERRPGLGIARKRVPFSLRTTISHPSLNLEPTLDINHLEDPDLFFDAYERNENAKKEIQKQLGGNKDNIDLYKPSNKERRRRPGILGKSYHYKHHYSSTASENDDMCISSQETAVYQRIPSPPKDESQESLMIRDPNIDADLEEAELAESTKKAESQVNDMLEELLSCNYEDLEGEGALNILQERFKINTLDMENRYCLTELPDVGRTNILTSSGSRKKPRKSSVVLDSVLKNLNKKPQMEQELVENPVDFVSSPTPPRCPFGSMSLLKKKIFQPNPLRDSFSPEDFDLCVHANSSSAQPKDKLIGQFSAPKDLGMCNELESNVEFGYTEPVLSDIDSQEVMGKADKMPDQSRSENASMQRESGSSRANAIVGQVATLKDLGSCNELESHVELGYTKPSLFDMDSHDVMGKADKMPEQSRSENASMQRESGSSRANDSPAQPKDKLVGQVDAPKDLDMFSEMESNVEFDSTTPPFCNLETHKIIGNAGGLPEQFEDENACIPSMDAITTQNEESDNIGNAMNTNGKAGTSFETGVRRSKRVKMRPLEYWKGERFLYGRIDNSLKLIGVKYFSPGKSNEDLKVKPYILSDKPEYKEVLDLAARH
ncbi:centromere protein C [Perilla frutescens var. frutescens]|nr:centromere protein C [Perilla frutescens var. frutescens]